MIDCSFDWPSFAGGIVVGWLGLIAVMAWMSRFFNRHERR